ncbi:MAG: hypothetical protein LBH02_02915 [Methanocalculaceae archaeon]|jgi:hypothetical protein|nr:hypothetical protein [Methanocalculaceae archaeon]
MESVNDGGHIHYFPRCKPVHGKDICNLFRGRFSKQIPNIIVIDEIHHEDPTTVVICAESLYLIRVGIGNIEFFETLCKKVHKQSKAKNDD